MRTPLGLTVAEVGTKKCLKMDTTRTPKSYVIDLEGFRLGGRRSNQLNYAPAKVPKINN